MTDLEIDPYWTDLAQPRLGSAVTFATDDFFADKARLINPIEPVFIPGKYDENGKWMDGWESRRKRSAGHDYSIIKLGRPGFIEAFEIDTRHFTGNFAPAASIDICESDIDAPDNDAGWQQVLGITALKGDDRKLFRLNSPIRANRVRLNIFPDGGVARLRIYGRVDFDAQRLPAGTVFDLLALESGGRAIAAIDEHFGRLENLIAPGRGRNMGDGWETRRRRTPGHDWAILALACAGIPEEVIVDTAHFKGNFPDSFFIQGGYAPNSPDSLLVTQSQFWPILMGEQRLQADKKHSFRSGLRDIGPITHIRFNIIPDGGVSRLRLMGQAAFKPDA